MVCGLCISDVCAVLLCASKQLASASHPQIDVTAQTILLDKHKTTEITNAYQYSGNMILKFRRRGLCKIANNANGATNVCPQNPAPKR